MNSPSPALNPRWMTKLLVAALAGLGMSTPSAMAESRTVNAVLFGYIPDANHDHFAALTAQLKQRFEQSNPDIKLNLTLDPNVDVYDMTTLSKLLGDGPEAVQLVEVDMVMLGKLVHGHLAQPIAYQPTDTATQALNAAKIDNTLYAVPTYLCSNVIYSPASRLEEADDSKSLVKILADYYPGNPPLIGNYKGSWTLSGYYTDAWADTNTNNPEALPGSLHLPLQDATVRSLSTAVDSCETGAKNPCLDGTYKDNTLAMEAFARGEANGYVGYTENLFEILSARAKNAPPLHVISAPVGRGEKPVMYVDGLVLNTHCTGQCAADAEAVSKYLTTTETRNLIAFSQDAAPGAIPRYLMQANTAFYTSEPAASNPFYQAYWRQVVTKAEPVPNSGVPESKDAISKALQAELTHQPKVSKRKHKAR